EINPLAFRYTSDVFFGDREIEFQVAYLVDSGNYISRRNISAGTDIPQSKSTAKRSADFRPVDLRFYQVYISPDIIQVQQGNIVIIAADALYFQKTGGPVLIGLRNSQLGFQLFQLRLQVAIVNARQQSAFGNRF